MIKADIFSLSDWISSQSLCTQEEETSLVSFFSVSQQVEHCIPFLWTVKSHGTLKALFKPQDSHILHSAGDCRKKFEARVVLTLDSLSNRELGRKFRTFSTSSCDPEINKEKIASVGNFFILQETLHRGRFRFRRS